MNEIIKLTAQTIGGEPQQTVNARELHEALMIKSNFRDWIKNRISDFGFLENQDFATVAKNLAGGGKSKEYFISIGMAKELCMVERNDLGRKWRRYFIDCEQQLQTVKQAIAIPQTLPEALRLAADLAEKNQQLIEQAKADAPKVEFSEAVVASDTEMTITATAKVLGIGPRKFFDWLRLNGFLYKQANQATQDAINRGYMVVRFHSIQHEDGVEQKAYPHVTGAGLFYFYGRLRKENLIQRNEKLELAA